MKKVLPISDSKIYATTHQASLLAILFAYPESYPWVYSNYIQQFTLRDIYHSNRVGTLDFFIDHYGDYEVLEHRICPMIRFARIPREFLNETDIIGTLIKYIDDGNYLYCTCDVFYISCWTNHFQKHHFPHMALVYGYDTQEKVFYMGDNYFSGKYSLQKIPFSEMESSMRSYINGQILDQSEGIELLKYRSPFIKPHYEGDWSKEVHSKEMLRLKIGKIINDIQGYLLYPEQSYQFQDSPLYAFGIAQHAVFREYIQNIIDHNDRYVDVKFTSSMLDHKVLMKLRVDYIHSQHTLGKYEELSENIQCLIEMVHAVQMLIIKYNIAPSDRILQKIYNNSFEIENKEKYFLELLLHELQTEYKNVVL